MLVVPSLMLPGLVFLLHFLTNASQLSKADMLETATKK